MDLASSCRRASHGQCCAAVAFIVRRPRARALRALRGASSNNTCHRARSATDWGSQAQVVTKERPPG
eukprot:scaffold87717_cov64-Phaeocystis_antarctica.AAC.7